MNLSGVLQVLFGILCVVYFFEKCTPVEANWNSTIDAKCCCKYASAVCYSLWLYSEMLLENCIDRVSGRLLSEISTSEMAIDGRRPPYTVTSDIKRLVYIA
jgi:hypothetical protein